MRRICEGIVAENSATCLSSGRVCRIVSTSSMKPIRSISSASSSTRQRSSHRSREPFSRWSMTRPGVPTTTCTPRRSALQLDAVALPAIDRQHVEATEVSGIPLEGLAHLEGELASGSEHERLRRLLLEVELRQDRQRERGRLAGAGLRQPDDVAALQQRRDGRGLDRRGVLVAEVAQGLEEPLVQTEVGEGRLVAGFLAEFRAGFLGQGGVRFWHLVGHPRDASPSPPVGGQGHHEVVCRWARSRWRLSGPCSRRRCRARDR